MAISMASTADSTDWGSTEPKRFVAEHWRALTEILCGQANINDGAATQTMPPEDLVNWFSLEESASGMDTPEVVREAFGRWFAARGLNDRRLAVSRLEQVADPRSIVRAAHDEYREKGNAERLVAAADLLENHGERALGVFRDLASSGTAESAYFVDALVNFASKPAASDTAAGLIRVWSAHPSPEVRLRLVEASDVLPETLRLDLLARLAADADRDVAEAAEERTQADN